MGVTAIAVRSHIGITAPRMPCGIASNLQNLYEVVPGHLSAVVVNGWGKSRFLAISVYMYVHDKFHGKNTAILLAIGMLITANALLYVVMGIWNNNPQDLASTGWLDTVDGYVIAPHIPHLLHQYGQAQQRNRLFGYV